MKVLRELNNQSIGELDKKPNEQFRERLAARAVLLDDQDRAAIIEAKNIQIHKILGGGVEEGENIELALEREIMEESGCRAKVIEEVGEIIEHRTNINLIQKNYCYIARLIGDKGQPEYTVKEKEEGFELIWVSLDEAVNLFSSDSPTRYSAKFQQVRDEIFLREAKNMLEAGK